MYRLYFITTETPRTAPDYATALDMIAREFPQHPRAGWTHTDEGPGALYVYPNRKTFDNDGAPMAALEFIP